MTNTTRRGKAPGNCPTNIKDLKRRLSDLGVDISRGGNNHLHFRYNGKLVATSASTPSDIRTIRNVVADLRRNGVDVKQMVVTI
jgi:hypothetical protein